MLAVHLCSFDSPATAEPLHDRVLVAVGAAQFGHGHILPPHLPKHPHEPGDWKYLELKNENKENCVEERSPGQRTQNKE